MVRSHSPGEPSRASVSTPLLAALATAGLAIGLHWWLADAFGSEEARWDAWRHRPLDPWSWTPFIHPPPYGEFLRAMEAWATSSDRPLTELFLKSSALVAGATVLVSAGLYRRALGSGAFAAAGALLLALSPASLRPFEQYPAATLLLTGSIWMFVRASSGGGGASLIAAAVLGLASISLHLSCWFLLGPLLLFLALAHRERRGALLLTLVGMIGLFLLGTTWPDPGMWGLFEHPHAYFDEQRRFGEMQWSDINLEWTNRWLLLPLLLWVHPRVRRASPLGIALTASLLAYGLITSVLMASGLAISGDLVGSHHYFELVDPLLVLTALLALVTASRELSWLAEPRRLMATVSVLVLSQVWMFGSGVALLHRVADCPWLWQDFHDVVTLGRVEQRLGTQDAWIAVRHGHDPDDRLLGITGRLELVFEREGSPPTVVEADAAGYRGEFPQIGLQLGANLLPLQFTLSARAYDRGTGELIASIPRGEVQELLPGSVERVTLPAFTLEPASAEGPQP